MADENQHLNLIRSEPYPHCYLCGTKGEALYNSLPDRFFGTIGTWNLKRCPRNDCGLIWLDPMPLQSDLGKSYETYFTHDAGNSSVLRQLAFGIYRAATWLPARISGLSKMRQQIKRMYLDQSSPGKLLDVGCGDGAFLAEMETAGWDCEGIDFDAKAIERAKSVYGLKARAGALKGFRFAENQFDAVTMKHVIEHLPNPIEDLQECHRILKPGGQLVVATPNSRSLGHQLFKENWMNLDPPRHLFIFSPPTLEKAAKMAGFHRIRTLTTAANADIMFAVSLAVRSRGKHEMGHHTIPGIVRPLQACALQFQEVRALKNNPGIGEELILIAQK